MDELPRDARALLELAKDGHDPPDEQARARVRTRLAVAVSAAAVGSMQAGNVPAAGAASSAGAGKGALTAWFGGKGWLAAVLIAGVGGATLLASNQRQVPRSTAPAPHRSELAAQQEPARSAVAAAPQPEVAPNVDVAADTRPIAASKPRTGVRRAAVPSGLAQETELLSRAAQLLARGDVAGARLLLQEHRRAFPRPQLREEREGLLALAHCMEAPSAARGRAQQFIAHAPASVLAPRIARACSLNQ